MAEQNKTDAMTLVNKLERDVAAIDPTEPDAIEKRGGSRKIADTLLAYAAKRISGANPEEAAARVRNVREANPEYSADELVEALIKAKCQKTALVGASTSAASIVPGLGTAVSLTLGLVVDIGATLKMHSELVLEIAEAYHHRLTDSDRSEVLLAITGLSAGFDQLGGQAVKGISKKVGELAAQKWMAKAIPAIGMAASASTNVLATYIIGKRAQAYFARGPEALGDWKDNLRAISGVDERKIAQWIAESSRSVAQASADTGNSLVESGRRGMDRIAEAGRKAGRVVSQTAGSVMAAGRTVGQAVSDAVDDVVDTGMAAGNTIVEGAGRAAGIFTRKKQEPDLSEKKTNPDP